jgi:hypothetical protein
VFTGIDGGKSTTRHGSEPSKRLTVHGDELDRSDETEPSDLLNLVCQLRDSRVPVGLFAVVAQYEAPNCKRDEASENSDSQ